MREESLGAVGVLQQPGVGVESEFGLSNKVGVVYLGCHTLSPSILCVKAPLTLAKVSTVSNHTPFHLYDCDFLLSAPRITIAGREPWVAQSSYRHLKSWATGGRRGERSGEMKEGLGSILWVPLAVSEVGELAPL